MCDGRKVWLNGAPPAMSATEATGDKPLHRLVPPAWRLDDARHYALSPSPRSAAPRATPPYMRARQTPPRHLRSPYSDSPMGLTPSEPASPPATATPTRGSTPRMAPATPALPLPDSGEAALAELRDCRRRVAEQHVALLEKDARISALDETLAGRNAALSDAQVEASRWKQKAAEYEKLVDSSGLWWGEQKRELDAEVATVRERCAAKVAELARRTEKAEAELVELKVWKEAAISQLEQSDSAAHQRATEAEELRSELAQRRKANTSLVRQLAEIEGKVAQEDEQGKQKRNARERDHQQQVAHLESIIAQLKEAVDQSITRERSSRAHLDESRAALTQAAAENALSEDRRAGLASDLSSLTSRAAAAEARWAAALAARDHTVATLQAAAAAAQKEHEAAGAAAAELRLEVAELREAASAARQQADRARLRADALAAAREGREAAFEEALRGRDGVLAQRDEAYRQTLLRKERALRLAEDELAVLRHLLPEKARGDFDSLSAKLGGVRTIMARVLSDTLWLRSLFSTPSPLLCNPESTPEQEARVASTATDALARMLDNTTSLLLSDVHGYLAEKGAPRKKVEDANDDEGCAIM
ncbi:hypothetical protein DIPPA_10504 [Diplonema papillatum]|nr:hypothetical protein DIPPA_10504 [Diplonema papillatum]KAJ9464418.1 hypothetical protein DIPPA_10504 [Diplonema papillatum]